MLVYSKVEKMNRMLLVLLQLADAGFTLLAVVFISC
jgi:hypothetical protein